MNERIRELAEQAMVTIPAAEGPLSHTYFDKEKFAELIVRECAGVAEITMPPNSYPNDVLMMKNAVLEHFGVE